MYMNDSARQPLPQAMAQVPPRNCRCNRNLRCPKMMDDGRLFEYPIAMAYVPWQKFHNLYEPERALCRGTMFQDLDLEFLGKRGCRS